METKPAPKGLREKLEALLFAGLKPGMKSSEIKQLSWKDHIKRTATALAAAGVLFALFYWVVAAKRPDFQRAWEQFTGKDIGQIASTEVEVVELSMNLETEPKVIGGKVKNNSDRSYSRVDVTFALTDANGSAVGAETVSVANVGARSSVPFRAAIATREAVYYVIRDIETY